MNLPPCPPPFRKSLSTALLTTTHQPGCNLKSPSTAAIPQGWLSVQLPKPRQRLSFSEQLWTSGWFSQSRMDCRWKTISLRWVQPKTGWLRHNFKGSAFYFPLQQTSGSCDCNTPSWSNMLNCMCKHDDALWKMKGPWEKTIRDEYLWFCRDLSLASVPVWAKASPLFVCVCLFANIAYIACLNVRVAWNNQVNTAQAWGWAACCCALLSTICLCQKYLLCTEWGMKSIQVFFFLSPVVPSLRRQKSYWCLPDQPTLSNVTTRHQRHPQTDHLVSSVQ